MFDPLQSVILIFSHDASGSAGLILNRPTEHQIGRISGTGKTAPQQLCTPHSAAWCSASRAQQGRKLPLIMAT